MGSAAAGAVASEAGAGARLAPRRRQQQRLTRQPASLWRRLEALSRSSGQQECLNVVHCIAVWQNAMAGWLLACAATPTPLGVLLLGAPAGHLQAAEPSPLPGCFPSSFVTAGPTGDFPSAQSDCMMHC